MALREKMDSNVEVAELAKDGVGKAISLMRLQWNDLESHLDSSECYLQERFTQLQSRELYLEERFTQLQAREKHLLSIQDSVAGSNKHLDSIRQSLEKKAKEIEHKHHEFCAFQKQHFNELKLKEKQLDLIQKSVEGSIKEMELREEKLAAHQRSIEGFFDKLDLEMKQFQNIQKWSGERLEEINRKEIQLESSEVLLQSARKCINDVLGSCCNAKKRKQQSEGESKKKHKISGPCPREQVESRTATEKMSTPEKANFQSATSEFRRVKRIFETTPWPWHSNGAEYKNDEFIPWPWHSNGEFAFSKDKNTKGKVDSNPNNELRRSRAGFPTPPGPGHSNGAKDKRHGEFTFSKDEKTKQKVDSNHNNELRRSGAGFPTPPGPGLSNGAKDKRHREFTFSKDKKTKGKADSNPNHKLRRSQAGFPTTPGPGLSTGAKDKRHGEFIFSRDEITKQKVDSNPNNVSEEVFFHDFTLERSWDKLQTGQIWAMYENGLPNRYVQIKSTTPYSQGLHVQSVVPHTASQSLCCGRFSVQKGKEFYSQSLLSHMVKAQFISKTFFEIYPRKGQVWAICGDWKGNLTHSYVIVEVLEDTGEPRKVSPLIRVSGFKSVFRAILGQRSKGDLVIPREELSRFSHQIPAFQLTGETDIRLRGHWELDPTAVPGLKFPMSTAPNT